MKKLLLLMLIFTFLIPLSTAQVITLGVSPSEFKLKGSGSTCFNINFFNSHGEVDAIYTPVADECMSEYVTSGMTDVLVPMGTTMSNNPVEHEICLDGDFTELKDCFIYIYGKPVDVEETDDMLTIRRRIGVRFKIGDVPPTTTTTTTTTIPQTTTTTTTTSPDGGGSGWSGWGESGTTTTTTNTSNTTTTTTPDEPVIIHPTDEPPTKLPPIIDRELVETPTLETPEQSEKKSGIVGFFMYDPRGLYIFIGFIFLVILAIGGLIAKGKYESKENLKWVADGEEKLGLQ